jgi:dimethylpropiothetin dethiomethylase
MSDPTPSPAPISPVEMRLSDRPEWVYLLRDFYELYRDLPAGGSVKIRSHQRAVRERVARVIKANARIADLAPLEKPVTKHFRRALDQGREARHSAFIRTIDAIHDRLQWQYGYEKVPRGLEQKYAYAELVGPTGPVITNEVILGLVLFAPSCTYPAHAHDGITESYLCLSGAVSENDQGVYAPGSLIFNQPGQLHRITVADNEPSLLAYAWLGATDKLANQKMVFSRAPKARR